MCHFGLKNGVTVRLGSTKVSAPAHIPRAEARAKHNNKRRLRESVMEHSSGSDFMSQ
jgi:hypothetical protein